MRAWWCAVVLPLVACTGRAGKVDTDGDGFVAGVDCNDLDALVFPGADERCDGRDTNCDGLVDNEAIDALQVYEDEDGDGFGDPRSMARMCALTPEYVDNGEDCDDNDSEVSPLATEVCDGVDADCDGAVDEDSLDAVQWFADLDGDGFGDPLNAAWACEAPSGFVAEASDCDDVRETVFPGAPEVCDAVDSDCDGAVGEVLVPVDYPTVQAALDAEEPEICVAPGQYAETLVFSGQSGVTIEGAGGSSQVVLDGGGEDRVVVMEGGESEIALRGLTLANGASDGVGGAGLYADGVIGLTLSDVVFDGNTCTDTCLGGVLGVLYSSGVSLSEIVVHSSVSTGRNYEYGLVALYFSGGRVDGVVVRDNVIDRYDEAGALWGAFTVYGDDGQGNGDAAMRVSDVTLVDNELSGYIATSVFAQYWTTGVDVSRVTVADNTLVGRYTVSPFLTSHTYGDVAIANVAVVGNHSTATSSIVTSGGFWNHYAIGETTVSNVVIAGNGSEAPEVGSPALLESETLWTASYANLTVHGNTATAWETLYGGSVQCADSEMVVVNATVTDNAVTGAGDLGGWSDASDGEPCEWRVRHSNTSGNGTDFGPTLTDWTGSEGNMASDPAFLNTGSADPTAWDLSPAAGSPLIDAGDPSILDADGTTSDIGAYGGPLGEVW